MQALQELAVVAEIDPQHDGQAEDVLTVRHRESNGARDELPEEQDFLLVDHIHGMYCDKRQVCLPHILVYNMANGIT